MRLAAYLSCTAMTKDHFNGLRRHENLPHDGGTESGWQNFSLEDAMRMRFMLDLMGGAIGGESDAEALKGLPPSTASSMVENIMGRFPWHPLKAASTGPELWGGVVVFEELNSDPEKQPLRYTGWFADEIDKLPGWIAGEVAKNVEHYGRPLRVVRVFLANATRAAAFVRQKAAELGIPEDSDFSEVK